MAQAALVGQLCRLFLADREGLVTAFRVYLDEGGVNAGAKVLTVAGYVAKPSQWQLFTKEWNKVLKPTGLTAYHATDAQGLYDEFRDWTRDDVVALVKKLLPIITKYARGIAIAIVMDDFQEAFAKREDLKAAFASPYGACFQWLVQSLLELADRQRLQARFAFVHETNDMKREAIQAFDFVKTETVYGDRLISLSFADKKEFPPLQAADILAFEVQKRLANQEKPERKAFTALGEPWIRFYDKKNLHKLIASTEKVIALRKLAEKQSS